MLWKSINIYCFICLLKAFKTFLTLSSLRSRFYLKKGLPVIAMQMGYLKYAFSDSPSDNVFGAHHMLMSTSSLRRTSPYIFSKPNYKIILFYFLGVAKICHTRFNNVKKQNPFSQNSQLMFIPEVSLGSLFFSYKIFIVVNSCIWKVVLQFCAFQVSVLILDLMQNRRLL